ncbi:MAG: hypothetical protein HS116_27675 [Planctomycetes bacterium]|nr:hypothetical protein [Planctomycetota bacterium]
MSAIEISVFCADIGRIDPKESRNRFGWAGRRAGVVDETPPRGHYPAELAEAVVAELGKGSKVALGFECPTFVPVDTDHFMLTKARKGEGNRPWSAGAGAASLAAGLSEIAWTLQRIKELMLLKNWRAPEIYLDPQEFHEAAKGLLLWEAFVTNKPAPTDHADDATAAVNAFCAAWPGLAQADVFAAEDRTVFSVTGAAILHAGFTDDVGLLWKKCVGIRA